MKWENVSIFISSTFQDMHGERDYLVKEVFPELLSWCESRRLHLYDIDLRWGISVEDSRNNNTVAACMHNVDRCRPFFICFLAQRRGWVPEEQDINRTTVEEYPGLTDYLGKRSITEMEIEHALLSPMNRMYEGVLQQQEPCKRALFFFRTESYLEGVPESERNIYVDSPENVKAAEEFKTVIRRGGYPVNEYDCVYEKQPDGHGHLDQFTSGDETLGQVLLRELKEQIMKEFPDHVPAEGEEDLAGIQEEFVWRDEESYYPQKEDLLELNRYLSSDERQTLCVTGKSGCGKTSLMCAMVREYRGKSRFIARFCGISPKTSDLYSVLAGILEECGIPVPAMEKELFGRLDSLFGKIAAQENTILLVDGLNQARDGMHLPEILPFILPEGLKIILSCKEESLTADLLSKTEAYGSVRFWHLKTVCDGRFKRGVIERFLSLYLKKLDEDDILLITENTASDTPLHLSVILSELRVFGNFQEIRNLIRRLSSSIGEAFSEILTRLERESDPVAGIPLSRAAFGMLSCSRNGLSEHELITAICMMTKASGEEIRPLLRVLLRQVRPFLSRRGQLYDFFHESFRNAAAAAVSADSGEFHASLADMFYLSADPLEDHTWESKAVRPFTEYPYHLAMAGRQETLKALVMDPDWIRSKMKAAGMQALLYDYEWTAGERACDLTGGALRLAAPVLMQDPDQLAVQLEGRLFSRKEEEPGIRALFDDLEKERHNYWLRPVNNAFVSAGRQELAFRHGEYAVTAMCIHLDDLAVVDEMNRIGIYNRQSGERKNLIHVKGPVVRCLVSDGRLLYAGCGDGTVSVWQTQRGTCVRVLTLTGAAINDLKFSGSLLYAADEAGCMTVYDCSENRLVRTVSAGKYPLLAVAPGKDRVCFGGMDQKVCLLEENNRTVWKTKSGYVGNMILTEDHLVYTTFYPRITFRNLKEGTLKTADYTDGYDFNVPDSPVMETWRKKGPYIRDLVCLGDHIAIATPFSVAVFPAEGADEPSETCPCQDTRALAVFHDMVYAGNGKGEICSFQTGLPEQQKTEKPLTRIVSMVTKGKYLAVMHETCVRFFETKRDRDSLALIPLWTDPNGQIQGYYTDIVPWKNGFAAGTHCELTLWKTPQEKLWHLLYQSQKLSATDFDETPLGTRKLVSFRDHLVFLTKMKRLCVMNCKDGPLPEKISAELRRFIRIGKGEEQDQVETLVKCSETAFAAVERNGNEIVVCSCDDAGVFVRDRFPDRHQVRLMASSPDGLLYMIGEDGCLLCLDPASGFEAVISGTDDPLQAGLMKKALAMTAGADRICVSFAGGWLIAFDRKTGTPCCSFKADADISALYMEGSLLCAGTETGRIMAFQEENPENAVQCTLPEPAEEDTAETAGKTAESERKDETAELPGEASGSEQTGDRRPEPVIRIVPPDEDPPVITRIRIGCAFAPVIATLLSILIHGGLPGIWNAVTLGLPGAGGKAGGLLLSAILVMIEVIAVLAFTIGADLYYAEMRGWIRVRKLPVLDRYILPLLLLIIAVPCLPLTCRSEGFPAGYMLSLFLPFLFFMIYYPVLNLLQTKGVTRRLAHDGTYIDMEEAYFRLRVTVVVLHIIFIAGIIWAVNNHPQWFYHMFWKE